MPKKEILTDFEVFMNGNHKPDRRFEPQSNSVTEGEEMAYRRGFDQGLTALLRALGLTVEEARKLHFKQRSEAFRYGDQKYPPWDATPAEQKKIKKALMKCWTEPLYRSVYDADEEEFGEDN